MYRSINDFKKGYQTTVQVSALRPWKLKKCVGTVPDFHSLYSRKGECQTESS